QHRYDHSGSVRDYAGIQLHQPVEDSLRDVEVRRSSASDFIHNITTKLSGNLGAAHVSKERRGRLGLQLKLPASLARRKMRAVFSAASLVKLAVKVSGSGQFKLLAIHNDSILSARRKTYGSSDTCLNNGL